MVPRPLVTSPPAPLVPEYFAGREVFITGATGFMGKVLVERLLWTCRDVSRLHLLLRHKRDVAPEKRLAQLKQSQVFDVVRAQCPQQLDKLCAVPGDITKPRLGMSVASTAQLGAVSVVFHVAATIKFDEPLRAAVQQNIRSVLSLMDLCDQLPHLQVFVHVSTAYSNAELSAVEERVYEAPLQVEQLLALVDALPDDLLHELTPRLIAPKPNTYTFTKALAESAVSERARSASYAVGIFRPSIVVSSLRSPFPGWVENLNGPSGVVAATGKGMLHVLRCRADRRADMVPVDLAIDTLIAVAWQTGVDDVREARVFHCSSFANPTTWGEFKTRMIRELRAHPFDNPMWYPVGCVTPHKVVQRVLATCLQTIPMNLLDFVCRLCGVKQRVRLSVVCQRLRAMDAALQYFALREWHFATDNTRRLRERLAPPDAQLFNLDVHTIDWDLHMVDFVKGARRYLLKESDEHIATARTQVAVLHVVHKASLVLLALLGARLVARSGGPLWRRVAALLEFRRKHYKLS